MRRHNKNTGRTLLIAVILIAVIGGGLFAVTYFEKQEQSREAEAISATEVSAAQPLQLYYNGRWYRLRDGVETCLVLGIDKFSDYTATFVEGDLLNDLQSDVLLLMIEDKAAGVWTALQLNRDTMCEIRRLGISGEKTGTVFQQLCLSHTYGSGGKDSCRNSVKAVSRLLYDVPIDHYYAVTMDAIPVLNDLVGGVTVHVDDDLTAADPVLVQGTDVTLHGDQALHFVRARMSVADGTNLSRMNRQRVFLDALYTQMRTRLQNDSRFALSMANRLAEYSTSDLIPEELSELAERLKDEEFRGIQTTMGEAVQGEKYLEFYPDEEKLKTEVLSLFFEPV